MVDATRADPVIARERLPVFNTAGAALRIFVRGLPVFLVLGLLEAVPSTVHLAVFHPVPGRFFDPLALAAGGVRILVASFLQIPLVHIAVHLFEGRDYALADAFGLGLRRYLPVLGAVILYLLAFYIGLVLLVVPGIVFAGMFAVVLPVAALEARGPIAAFKRTAALTRFNRWRVLAAYLLYFMPLMIVGLLLGGLTTLRGYTLLGPWLGIAVQAIWGPFAGVLSVAIYVALRRLKDGGGFGVASVFD